MWCRESAGRHRRVHFPYGDVREKHTHIMYSTTCTHRGFSVLLTAAVCMCVQTTHVMFLSIICHTYCTIIVLLSAIIPAGIFIFCQHDTQCVQLCVGRDPSVLVCVSIVCFSCTMYVCPSCGHFTAVLHFRTGLSQLSKCLFFFLHQLSIEIIVINV